MRTSSIALILMAVAGCARREPQAESPATASLASAIAVARQQPPEAAPRRLWVTSEADIPGAPSPDGKLLAYLDVMKDGLGIRDLRTGENRFLTHGGDATKGFADNGVFSSDGKRMAFGWIQGKGSDLRVVDVAGSEPRIVATMTADVESISALDWTPDDREILAAIKRADRTLQLAHVNVATGTVRAIRTFTYPETGSGSGTAALSPDGRYVAMSVPSAGAPNAESDVVILTREASREVARIEGPGVDGVIGWTADGRLFYLTTRDAAGENAVSSLFAVQTRNGTVTEAPQLVKADMSRVVDAYLTDDGRLFYTILAGSYDVYVASVDVPNARVLSPAVRSTHRLVGFNQGIDWTADGRYAAYLVRMGAKPRSRSNLAIRDQESGDVREIRPDLEYINPAFRWSPDGRAIIVMAKDLKGKYGVYSIDAASGKVTPVVYANQNGGGTIWRPQWAPDGRSIYYAQNDTRRFAPATSPASKSAPLFAYGILHRDVERGTERVVFAAEGLGPFYDLSADGANLAVMTSSRTEDVISVVPAAGGSARELLRVPRPYMARSITWSRDGKYVLFARLHTPEEPGELWRVSVESGQASAIGPGIQGMSGLRVHPDGRRIGYTGGIAQPELWVTETRSAKAQAGAGPSR